MICCIFIINCCVIKVVLIQSGSYPVFSCSGISDCFYRFIICKNFFTDFCTFGSVIVSRLYTRQMLAFQCWKRPHLLQVLLVSRSYKMLPRQLILLCPEYLMMSLRYNLECTVTNSSNILQSNTMLSKLLQ